MKPAPLVSYLSSDDEEENSSKNGVKTAGDKVQYDAAAAPPLASVHTSLCTARRQPLPGDWLCYVFIPLHSDNNDDGNLSSIFRKAVRRLRAAQPADESQQESLVLVDDPHISLTRPILLRKHECDRLVPCVREALQAFHGHPVAAVAGPASSHRLTLAFSLFSALPSQDATRTFWAADVSQGWADLRRLTKCLDVALTRVYARPYFEQPRFHASFAHQPAASQSSTTSALATLNGELGARLRACDAVHVDSLGIAIGSSTQYVTL